MTPYFSWHSLRLCVRFLINFCENNKVFGNNRITTKINCNFLFGIYYKKEYISTNEKVIIHIELLVGNDTS